MIRVLLVEDNPADAYLVREFLGDQREPAYALDHVETLAAAQRSLASDPPDIVLVDLSLPDSQGLETFTTAQGWAPDLPIVILTGLDDHRVALEAVRKGAQDYLPKGELTALVLTRVIGYALERSRKDQAIAARERKFRAMIEHSSDVIVLMDHAYRMITIHLGDATRRHTSFSPDVLEGEDLLAYIHPGDRDAVREALDAMPRGSSTARTLTYRFLQASGAWAWREAVATNLLDDPAVGAIVVNTRDIDERKRAEAESQWHKRILEAAIDSFPGVFILLNEDARLVMWNRNA
ncbi:MAG: response regulator [Trueperaceae bacterium]|nr:response regulator [Trueperaceae bacterium]